MLLFLVFPRARERWWLWVGLMVAAPLLEWTFKLLSAARGPEDRLAGLPQRPCDGGRRLLRRRRVPGRRAARRRRAWVRALATVMIVLVGVARVILRAHWPSDVLAGIALGLALAAAAGLLASRPADEAR